MLEWCLPYTRNGTEVAKNLQLVVHCWKGAIAANAAAASFPVMFQAKVTVVPNINELDVILRAACCNETNSWMSEPADFTR